MMMPSETKLVRADVAPHQPILQFGTGRFLLAHVDYFISEAMRRGGDYHALGGITVVQSTASPDSAKRIASLAGGMAYPVRVRGLLDGIAIDNTVWCEAIREAVSAKAAWPRLLEAMATKVMVIISNTADSGFQLDSFDTRKLIDHSSEVPRSYPAKLLVLLFRRWERMPFAPLSIFPCELIERNGDALYTVVRTLAQDWSLPQSFLDWLCQHCIWVNSLVDRIVSDAIDPVGSIAEPYALWVIERQDRMVMPCRHDAIVVTDDLDHYARLKLFFLNAGHTYLAEIWLRDGGDKNKTVQQAMLDPLMRENLESFWSEEILPVFSALGKEGDALSYLRDLRERLLNPYLAHRLADISQNHGEKKRRRFAPIIQLAQQLKLDLQQPRLHAALSSRACV